MYLELMIDYKDEYNYVIDDKYRVYIDLPKRDYIINLDEKYVKYLPIIRKLAKDYPKIERSSMLDNVDFNNFFSYNIEKIRERLLDEEVIDKDINPLTEIIFWESLNLSRIAPFLYDHMLNEVYIIGPDYSIHVEHSKYGKLKSNISVTNMEIMSFIRFLEFIKGEGILNTEGVFEVDLNTPEFHYRILIDSPQITFGNYNFCIRNLRRFHYNMEKLLEIGSLDPETLAILLLAIYFRLNIIVAGPPNTGKTTLLNSMINKLPGYIRRISIEDAREIIDLRNEGYNQVFYRSSRIRGLSKRKQLIFTLRRSPDYLIIGETLTEDDSKAFFHSLSLGLNVVTTVHSYSIDALIRRWTIHERINPEALNDIDLIIFMDREFNSNKRKVKDLYIILESTANKVDYLKLATRFKKSKSKSRENWLNEFAEKISRKRGLDPQKIKSMYYQFLEMILNGVIPSYDEVLRLVETSEQSK